MVTIKDIAKVAGVAQGTVSNVLNDKGNVSSEKMKHVLAVAKSLGYTPNERAKHLRKGRSNIIAVLLPNLRSKQYLDFYQSFKNCAENQNYMVHQYLTNDNPDVEKQIVGEIIADMAIGIASVTSCDTNIYQTTESKINRKIIFVERYPANCDNFIGFDFEKAGTAMGEMIINKAYKNIAIITGEIKFSNEQGFYNGLTNTLENSLCSFTHISTDHYSENQYILQMFDSQLPEAIVVSNYAYAENIKRIFTTFYGKLIPKIYTISPLFTLPENSFEKYELDYRLLGNVAANTLIKNLEQNEPNKLLYLKNEGFRDWSVKFIAKTNIQSLHVLTLNSPSAYAAKNVAKVFTQKTGIDVNFTIYSYEEIYEALMNIGNSSAFDIIRLDVNWLSWFSEKILCPLEDIDPDISHYLSSMLDGISSRYSSINNRIYTLPFSPSIQLLYYRKDLFSNTILKRIFQETFKKELVPPQTFEDFNQLARFFTKSITPSSPVDYGATITLGGTSVASCEFYARFFSYNDNLYDRDLQIRLNSPTAIKAMEQLIDLKQYSNPQYNIWWTDTATSFAQGNVAMSILYTNFASDLLRHPSKVTGNIGFTMVPGNNPVIGGGCLGISKYSKKKKESLAFLKWLCNDPVASAASLLGSISPCRSTYNNYEIVDTYPWMNLAKDSFSLSKGYRVPSNDSISFNEKKLTSILGIAVKNAYSGAMGVQESLDHAQKMYELQFLQNKKIVLT